MYIVCVVPFWHVVEMKRDKKLIYFLFWSIASWYIYNIVSTMGFLVISTIAHDDCRQLRITQLGWTNSTTANR